MRAIMLLGAVGLVGCGNLSNDDLVFLAAVPQAKDVALEVEEGQEVANALVGQRAEYYDMAYNGATQLNGGVAMILDFVDDLGRDFAPTTRSEHSRVWGPFANVDEQGWTVRWEIRRIPGDGQVRYEYCLHIGMDDEVGSEPACDQREHDGWSALLIGGYVPRPGEKSARSGQGELLLDFEPQRRRGLGNPNDKGTLAIQYEFSEADVAKNVHIDVTPGEGEIDAIPASYDYARSDDGRVGFFLSFPENTDDATLLREVLTIDACWREGGLGRAEVTAVGGDLDVDAPYTGTECWDEQQRRTFFRGEIGAVIWGEEGSLAACPPVECP